MQDLAFRALPSLAIAEGATTPSGGLVSAQAWSTTALKVLVWNGATWQALAAPGAPGVSSPAASVTLDFGAVPVYGKGFTFSDASATPASKIVMAPAADGDEYEMDGFVCAAYCAVAGVVSAFVHALPGPVTGTRKFNYLLAPALVIAQFGAFVSQDVVVEALALPSIAGDFSLINYV